VQLGTLDEYPRQVLRVLLALRQLEERQQHATYGGLQYVLGDRTRSAVFAALLRARRLGLVETTRSSRGGAGRKAVFALTDKGREALR
jgi:DNA-binding MarR family transcriptional regulator